MKDQDNTAEGEWLQGSRRLFARIGTGGAVLAVTTATVAPDASPSSTESLNVPKPSPAAASKKRARPEDVSQASEAANKRAHVPKWTRGFVWSETEPDTNPSAEATLTAAPFASIPPNELKNLPALRTIAKNPRLFKIVTPFNVDRFEESLADHPNRLLVESACRGLREGFWPFAETEGLTDDITEVENHPLDAEKEEFLKTQRDVEISLDRFSPAFDELQPGMHTTALGAVPKPHTDKLRLITDQSKGSAALNSFITREAAAVRYDNLRDLGLSLRAFRRREGKTKLCLWKSDISQAFRRIPMHPLWQIKQIVKIDGRYHVDRCMVFGNRASPRIWCLIAALIAWIAINKRGIRILHHYMDDFWSFERFGALTRYAPYNELRPSTQTIFLSLLDELGVPHEREKQHYGDKLTIIGFSVDANAMTFSMDDDSRNALVEAIHVFVDEPTRQHQLRIWQRLLGWANWGLNVIPLAKPALHSSYAKIAGQNPNARPYINASVKYDLLWFADLLKNSDGIYLVSAEIWDEEDAQMQIFCDASLSGIGFWSPTTSEAFYMRFPPDSTAFSDIYWNESFAVCCAFQYIAQKFPASTILRPLRAAIHTDSMNSVELFSTLRPLPKFVVLLLRTIETILHAHISHRVYHIAGEQNGIADMLSRGLLEEVRRQRPNLKILSLNVDNEIIVDLQRSRKGAFP
ncbi:hypothetical protein BD410DRAFT_712050 [Rickenella mellea]|uniref:Reverse transcriptase domain-containing protein n=1 Tax=Rickenella mellea TaxID=50990 RepID=A0A4Y7QLK6_9AGAM|nr:hypothetical protein BD410DRAFT_712050 [Rickenella mellea]